jgi:hypothetical protein
MMERRRRRPAKRLLIVPTILLAGLIGGLETFQNAIAPTVDASHGIDVEAEAPSATDLRTCSRTGEGAEPRELPAHPIRGRVTSEQVLACPSDFDGLRVTYVGELVGDLLERQGGAWILVNDDDYALEFGPLPAHGQHRGTNSGLAVWLPTDLIDRVTGLGRPNHRGDLVEIQGRIARTDPDDGGGLTMRADTLRLLAPSAAVDEPFNLPQFWLAVTALLIAAILALARQQDLRR